MKGYLRGYRGILETGVDTRQNINISVQADTDLISYIHRIYIYFPITPPPTLQECNPPVIGDLSIEGPAHSCINDKGSQLYWQQRFIL